MNNIKFEDELKNRLKEATIELDKAQARYRELYLLNSLYEEEKKDTEKRK